MFDLIRFTAPEHVESTLDGHLYMNSIGYFRKNGFEGQKDITEAVSFYENPDESQFAKMLPTDIREHLLWNIIWSNEGAKYCNVLSFYKLTKYQYEVERINGEISEFGEAAIHIYNVDRFIERIIRAVRNQKEISWCAGDVQYYNPISENANLYTYDCFTKIEKYANQKEWRLAILNDFNKLKDLALKNPNENYLEPFKLNIGSIRDIARVIPTKHLLSRQEDFFDGYTLVDTIPKEKLLTPQKADELFAMGIPITRSSMDGAYWGRVGDKTDVRRAFAEKINEIMNGQNRPMFTIG